MHRNTRYIFSFLIIFSFLVPKFFVYGADQLQMAQEDKARLEAELASLENEIAEKQKELESQKGQSVSITRDISILTTQINKSKLDIKSKNLTISKLGGEITQKDTKIRSLTEKIESEKDSLAQLLRKNREIDEMPILALILSHNNISDIYGDVDSFASIKKAVKGSVDEIRGVKVETETEKKTLEIKKNQEIDVKVALENTKRQVEKNEAEKKKLLSISKGKESDYQKILAEKAKRKAAILSALFNLRDTGAIPFGKALEYANIASKKTGIRPAFLLAILTQESNLGSNQGSCYLADQVTGAGVGAKSNTAVKNVMKPGRDIAPFLEITSSVGRDPFRTLVSCPIGGSGYGGAMGPSQFIPSTWQLIKNRVAKALDQTTADPWNPKDAFMASSLYLTDLGAVAGSYTGERNAACKYYSGRSCDSKKPANSFYGNSVIAKAKTIQETMIDPLQN